MKFRSRSEIIVVFYVLKVGTRHQNMIAGCS